MQIVSEAIPTVYFEFGASVPAAELAVHVLDYLHNKLDEMCLVQGGEVVNFFSRGTCIFLNIFPGSCCPTLQTILITGGSLSDDSLYVCWKLIAIYRGS